jgi:hypothetical protein
LYSSDPHTNTHILGNKEAHYVYWTKKKSPGRINLQSENVDKQIKPITAEIALSASGESDLQDVGV